MERSFKNHRRELSAVLLFLAGVVIPQTVLAKPPDWFLRVSKLELLVSSRREVEEVFDNPEITGTKGGKTPGRVTEEVEYKTREGVMEAEYATASCDEAREFAYDVARGTLVAIRFYPDKMLPFGDFGLPLNDFSKEPVTDAVAAFVVRNQNAGIRILVTNGLVSNFERYPKKKDRAKRCARM